MKRIVIFLVVSLLVVYANAQSKKNSSISQPNRPKVGVVLGGGGAKGASHIGVLKYIEEMGIPVDYVAGTSMGSIIGGFYAMGYSPEELTQLIAGINWSEYIGNKIDRPMMSKEARVRNSTMILNVPFSLESLFDSDPNSTFISQLPSAYVNNSSLINLFNDLCVGYQEEMDFNNLPIPFACVATDMISGQEVVLRSGSMPTAMRASMAIPGVFSPVTIGDKVLVDGGLVNNFPADVLKEMGADIIIGVEVTSTKNVTAKDLKSLPQVFARLLITSTSAKRKENRALCDVHIIPDISGFGMLSFTPEAIDTLVGRGYKKANEFHDQLLAIKKKVDMAAGHPVSKTLHAPHAKNLATDSVLIRSISINNVSDKESRWLIRKGDLHAGRLYTEDDIEQAMKIFRGTSCFDEITYQVKESDSIHQDGRLSDAYDLSINMTPAKPHVMGLGVRYDTDEGAALLFNLGLNEKKFGGLKFNANIKLSYSPRVNLSTTYSVPSLANFSIAYDYRYEHFRAQVPDTKKNINLHYRQHRVSGYISQFHMLNFSTNLGLSYTNTAYDQTSIAASEVDSTIFATNKLLTPYVNLEYDNLDNAYFAKHGIYARLTGRYHIDRTKTDTVYDWIKGNCFDVGFAFQAYITPGDGRFTIIPHVYGRLAFNSPMYYNLWNVYGGEIEGRHFENQMPFIGIGTVELTGDQISIFRTDLRYNFYGKHYLTAMYNISTDWGVLFSLKPDVFLSNIDHGAGIKYSYDTPLGPLSLTGHWSRREQENHWGVYFSFGYSF